MPLLEEFPQLKTVNSLSQKRKVKIYLIGGFLRDYLLNRPCLDFDFAVSKEALKLARAAAKKMKGAFVLLDKDRGCARVAFKRERGIQTFDFADFRAPTLKRDIAHRDFTINTLCLDLDRLDEAKSLEQILIDLKHGLSDIKKKKIKMVSVRAFEEDPLRLMRAFSLQAQLKFTIEAKTLTRIKKEKKLLKEISAERIRDELFKILATDHAAENFKAMDRAGLLEEIMPQITVMFHCKQGGYHHLDVWPHSLETVVQLERVFKQVQPNHEIAEYLEEPLAGERRRFALLKLAALLHDIGKPETRKKEQGKISFHGHERVGKKIVRSIALMLKLSTRERHILEDMVLWHLRPGYLSDFKTPSERSIFRYLRDTKEEAVSILLLSLADQRATRGPLTTQQDQKHHELIVMKLIDRYFEQKRQKPFKRLIDGYDLIQELKLSPSPLFSKILREIEEKQSLGKITDKKEALELAAKISKSNGL